MKVCIDKGTDDAGCCKAWAKGIRTINNQYPDDNREFGIIEGAGIVITPETAGIRIACTVPTADTLTAGDNIDISAGEQDELIISLVSDPVINGDIQVNGDIIQNGSAYETHAEKIYTTNDYIVTRDGAISALSAGDYSGFQVKKYDGTNDGRLVIDNQGTARVGDVGDEEPLLTRDESADLTDGALLKWNATGFKAVNEGTVGSDTKPIKIVNGVASAVTYDVINTQGGQAINGSLQSNRFYLSDTNHYIEAYDDSSSVRSRIISSSPSADIIGLLEFLYDNGSGNLVLRIQKRKISDGSLIGISTIATV